MQSTITEFIQQAHTILPIIDIDTPELIIPTIEALTDGGINAVEITLRNKAGLAAINIAQKKFPHTMITAGTITTPEQVEALKNLSTRFIISPGISPQLLAACKAHQLDILPGVATPSEILVGLEYGLQYFKFFPAEICGGVNMLRSLQGPFGDLQFCATGGINAQNAAHYLALDNVFCIGGSWIATKDDIENQRWETIYHNANSIHQQECEPT